MRIPRMISILMVAQTFVFIMPNSANAGQQTMKSEPSVNAPAITPIVRVVDVKIGEIAKVILDDGSKSTVKVLEVTHRVDSVRNALRQANVHVDVNGEKAWITCSTYALPKAVGGVQIDCPAVKRYSKDTRSERWYVDGDVRLRLWPEKSPLVRPNTFVFPIDQPMFATYTQMANEPVSIAGTDRPGRKVYYHNGLDFGASIDDVAVVSVTDGIVISAGTKQRLPDATVEPRGPRKDVVHILDDRGWCHWYSHLKNVDTKNLKPGDRILAGTHLGFASTDGPSGGWSHLHYDIHFFTPGTKQWGTQASYAFLFDAYRRKYKKKIIAVARPHHLLRVGETVTLDNSRCWAESGIASTHWTLSDGTTSTGDSAKRVYKQPGIYSEIMKITDKQGSFDYDFAVVHVLASSGPGALVSGHHATYHPSVGIKANDPIKFKVASKQIGGEESWDFGDGSPLVKTKSTWGGRGKYTSLQHRYAKPGDYIVTISRRDKHGIPATQHLHVTVQ